MMQFTLITSEGTIMLFYIKEMALLYHRLKGGVVITNKGEGIESLMPPVEKLLATNEGI
jgi:hypothetical protein